MINATAVNRKSAQDHDVFDDPTYSSPEESLSPSAKIFVPKTHAYKRWRAQNSSLLDSETNSANGEEYYSPTEDSNAGEWVERSVKEKSRPPSKYSNDGDRFVAIRGLAPNTTLANVLKHVRGGLVFFARLRARSAFVSFVDPEAARQFLIWAKHSNLTINGKLVSPRSLFPACMLTFPGRRQLQRQIELHQ